MTHKELLRLEGYSLARKLQSSHVSNNKPSRRAAKGAAKGLRLVARDSRVFSRSVEKLQWADWKYRDINGESRGQYQAS